MTAAARSLVLCADDFGAAAEFTAPIVALAAAGRVTAISCLSTHAAWVQAAPALNALPAQVSRGLHFNLSEGVPLSRELRRIWPLFPRLPRLLLAAHAHVLPLAAIRAEWQAQWQAFVDATGHAPGHVDGHQHVHHFPGVREIVLAALPHNVPVRHTGCLSGPGFGFKRGVIAHSGGRALGRALRRRGTPHNAALTGVYDFIDSDYAGLVRRWLRALPAAGGQLFCHPGPALPLDGDAIGAARAREAQYLGSQAFADDLARAQVRLVAPSQQSSSAG